MYDHGVVIGRVIGVCEGGPQSQLLIVEDRARPDYPNKVACEFYEKQRNLLLGIENGQLVRVIGSMKSRLYKDRWYTSFSCFQIQSLAHLDQQSRGASSKQGATPEHERQDDSSAEEYSSDPNF